MSLDSDGLPGGLVYIENFFSQEEQDRIIATIDAHQWSHEIQRRQQFYGPVYYFTPQALCSTLQPVTLQNVRSPVVLSADDLKVTADATNSSSDKDNQQDNNTRREDKDKTAQSLSQQSDLYSHPITPLQWVINKLVDARLFQRADVRDPFAEYQAIRADEASDPYLERVPAPLKFSSQSTLNGPMGPDERLRAIEKMTRNNQADSSQTLFSPCVETTPDWGDSDIYPDQILVNEYRAAMGIGTHFDDALSFGPQIIGISLGDECTLILSRPQCCSLANNHLFNEKLNNSTTTTNTSTNTSSSVEIEDLMDLVDSCFPSDHKPLKQSNFVPTSHAVSLRDFSTNDWQVVSGPGILGKYCRCTRQAMLTELHPNAKSLINLPIRALPPQSNQQSGAVSDTNNNATPYPAINKHQYFKSKAITEEFQFNNHPIPQTEAEVNSFILNYDYATLPHRKFHKRSGEDITPQDIRDQYEQLRSANPNIDFTPSLEQFNRCKYPQESFEFQLKPGSVYVLAGTSRYQYRHAIRKNKTAPEDDYRRVSLTVRSLMPGRRQIGLGSEVDLALQKRALYGLKSETVSTATNSEEI